METLRKHKALITGIGAGTLLGLTLSHLYKSWKESKLKRQRHKDLLENNDEFIPSDNYEDIVNEQLTRNYQYFGKENTDKIRKSFVVVIGVGGVGSHAVNALVRSGVEKIRIVDLDLVSISSLNRHAFALLEDVGFSKVAVIKKYCKKIFQHVEIDTKNMFLKKENLEELLQGKPDFVLDCIDDLTTKVDLLTYCFKNKIKIISSGGAGMRIDPTRLQIRDISDTSYDPLTRSIREALRRNGIYKGIPVLFCNDLPQKELQPMQDHQKENPDNYRVLPNMRLRIVPVVGTLPSLFGMAMASFVLADLGNQELQMSKIDDVNYSLYVKLKDKFRQLLLRQGIQPEFDMRDIYYVARDLCEWKCVFTGSKKGALDLIWFDKTKMIDGRNILIARKDIAVKIAEGKDWKEFLTEEQIAKAAQLIQRAEKEFSDELCLETNFKNRH